MSKTMRPHFIGIMAAALLAGCATMNIKYNPSNEPTPPAAAGVVLQVVDGRPADKLANKREVGKVRNAVGIPNSLDDGDENVVARTVGEATADALKRAGLGAQGGPKALVATVTEYWMDGYMGYKAGITVRYDLQRPAGPLWSQEVKGQAGGTSLFSGGPDAVGEKLFGAALADLASKANNEFKTPKFQQALAM
jgi:hypothetical protein